jgi:translocation and assembly module TamB
MLLALVGIVVVGVGIISTVDVAGDAVVGMAARAVKEKTGMLLSVSGARGNPVRGYTFDDMTLATDSETAGKRRLFSAKTLTALVNFMSLFRGAPKLSLLAVGGVDMDLDRLIEEISKIEFPESSPSGEIPVDCVRLQDSRFTSRWGVVDVAGVDVVIESSLMSASLAGAVNGVPVNGVFDVDVRENAASINKIELRVGKGLLTAAGTVGLNPDEEGTAPLDFQGSIKGLDASEITAFWPAFLSSNDYSGNADVDFTIEGWGSNLLIAAMFDFNGALLGGYPLSALSARLKYADMHLSIDDVKATTLSVPIEGDATIEMRTGQTPSVTIKLHGGDAPLSELAKLYPALGKVGGKVEKFTVNVQGPTDALSGTIELSAPNVVLLGKRIENLAVQVKLVQSDTATVNGKLILEGAQGYIQGTVAKILSGANLNLTAKLLNLDVKKVEDLIPDGKKYGLAGSLTADLAVKGKATSPSVSGTLGSPKFTASGYTLDKPSLTFAYDKDTFSLKESGGSWNGLPIKASGTVGPLSSPTPSISMTVQLSLKPENLKQFVPDIGSYKLQGTVNAGVKITGKLPRPKIDLVASSPAFSAFGTVEAKNLEVATALAGDLSKLDKIDLTLKAASVAAAGVGLQDLSASVGKDGRQVRLDNVSARSGNGTITGGGTALVAPDGKDAALNLAFDLRQLDLAALSRVGGGIALAGTLSGKVGVTGPSSNPTIFLSAQAPSLAVEGVTLSGLVANVSGNMKAVKIEDFRANVGGAPLSAKGNVSLADPFKADIDVSGDGLDLAALTAGIPGMKGQAAGKVDLRLGVESTAQGTAGTGSIRSAAVTAFGVKTSNVVLPLSLGMSSKGNVLKSEGGTLDLYGGKVVNNLTFDLKTMKFSNSLKASGVDVNALVQDASGGLGGQITGRGNLSLKIDGSAGKTLSYSGSGQFDMGEGGISGFSGLNVLSALYGVNGIRYAKVTAPLKIATGKLFIGKGASAAPPANDPIYKSAKLAEDGTVTFDKKLYFVVDANVNFQLINALMGGAAGGVDALLKSGGIQDIFGGKNLESALKGAISGSREQGKDADFRDVTAKATGTFDKPSVSLVKVGPSAKQEQTPKGSSADVAPAKTPGSPQEIIKEKIIDSILPPKGSGTPKPAGQNAQPQGQSEPANRQERPNPPSPEKQIEEEIQNQIQKGLDNLFKKR